MLLSLHDEIQMEVTTVVGSSSSWDLKKAFNRDSDQDCRARAKVFGTADGAALTRVVR